MLPTKEQVQVKEELLINAADTALQPTGNNQTQNVSLYSSTQSLPVQQKERLHTNTQQLPATPCSQQENSSPHQQNSNRESSRDAGLNLPLADGQPNNLTVPANTPRHVDINPYLPNL